MLCSAFIRKLEYFQYFDSYFHLFWCLKEAHYFYNLISIDTHSNDHVPDLIYT